MAIPPDLPPADRQGNREAQSTIGAMVAQDVYRDRRAAGMTRDQLAKATGLQVKIIHDIEAGHHRPSMQTIQKIDRALGNR